MLNPVPVAVTGFPEHTPHLSEEARRYFREMFSRAERDTMQLPATEDIAGWRQRNRDEQLRCREPMNAALLERHAADLQAIRLGNVPVNDIRPARGAIAAKALIYIHGGSFVSGAAHDARDSTLPLAARLVLWSPWAHLTLIGHTYLTLAEADRLREAGVSGRFENDIGMPHAFLSLASLCPAAPVCIDMLVGELQA